MLWKKFSIRSHFEQASYFHSVLIDGYIITSFFQMCRYTTNGCKIFDLTFRFHIVIRFNADFHVLTQHFRSRFTLVF